MVRRPVIHGPLEVVVSAPETRGSFHPYGTDQGPFQTPGTDRDFPESGNSGSVPAVSGVRKLRVRSRPLERTGTFRSPETQGPFHRGWNRPGSVPQGWNTPGSVP